MTLRRWMGGVVVLGSLLAAAFLARPVQAQDPITTLLGMINQARVSQGLPPYALNEALTRAAQRHAEDMATYNFVDHTGSDDSSAVSRILEAGYGVYTFGPVVGENIYGGVGGPDVPFTWWMNSSVHRANILHEKYREIGIGVAVGSNGWTYWTLTFGAQPNVLPVFINDGAGITDSPQVTLTLTEEKIAPQGDGLAIGQPIQMRASTQPDFPNAEWQPWATRVPFTLEPVAGPQTVYVQLLDAQGRTSLTWATITLTEEGAKAAATPSPAPTTPAQPSPTPIGETIPSPTVPPTDTPTPTATATPPPSPSPTATPPPSPLPPPTATATASPPPSPSPTPSPAPSPTAPAVVAVASPSPRPPTPPPSPQPAPSPVPTLLPLGTAPSPSLLKRLSALAIPVWAVLQVVAIGLGLLAALRRG